ncbi:pyridoxal phosphate-dependent decarboxylase family protein [Parasphingorhabdus pacifica]
MSSLANPAEDSTAGAPHRKADRKAYLLNERNVAEYRRSVRGGVERVASKVASADRPVTGRSAAQLEPVVSAIDLNAPLHDTNAALDELENIYLRDAVYFHHPRYLGHLNCPVVIPALLGEAVLSSVNSSLDTWDQSMGGTLMERRLIEWTAERIGFGNQADGIFTSGGTQSNLQAFALARDEACVSAERDTGRGREEVLSQLRIISSECSHFSVSKSAALLGLGRDSVISVPCDSAKRMRTDVVAAELERCRREGLIVMAVVATAGTTDFGSIDPLHATADLCARFGVWLHVDAAYGCGVLVSRRRRHLVDGIERANSVTVDYHKSFFQPVSSSAVLLRDRTTLRHVTYHADYLNPERSVAKRIPNQVDKSIQTTRRFDALKLWLTLRIMGADAIGDLFDDVVDLAAATWKLLADDPRFEVVTKSDLSTLVFRYVPSVGAAPEFCDQLNLHVRESLFGSGEAVVAGTVVDGGHYLKMTLLNPQTSVEEVAEVLELIADHARQFLTQHADDRELARPRAS